jgi:hypothetical protein
VSVTETNKLVLFPEILSVDCWNHTKQINALSRVALIVKGGGAYSYHCDLIKLFKKENFMKDLRRKNG